MEFSYIFKNQRRKIFFRSQFELSIFHDYLVTNLFLFRQKKDFNISVHVFDKTFFISFWIFFGKYTLILRWTVTINWQNQFSKSGILVCLTLSSTWVYHSNWRILTFLPSNHAIYQIVPISSLVSLIAQKVDKSRPKSMQTHPNRNGIALFLEIIMFKPRTLMRRIVNDFNAIGDLGLLLFWLIVIRLVSFQFNFRYTFVLTLRCDRKTLIQFD